MLGYEVPEVVASRKVRMTQSPPQQRNGGFPLAAVSTDVSWAGAGDLTRPPSCRTGPHHPSHRGGAWPTGTIRMPRTEVVKGTILPLTARTPEIYEKVTEPELH